jgi:hypothetical protein
MVFPAKLQCTYSFGLFCHECYARKHVKVLPKYLDLKPVKIDYRMPGGTTGFGGKKRPPKRQLDLSGHELGEHWHTFFDLRGCPYFYNFASREAMRRSTDAVLTDAESTKKMTNQELVSHRLINMAQGKGDRKLKAFGKKKNDVERYAKKDRTNPTATSGFGGDQTDAEEEEGFRAGESGGEAGGMLGIAPSPTPTRKSAAAKAA